MWHLACECRSEIWTSGINAQRHVPGRGFLTVVDKGVLKMATTEPRDERWSELTPREQEVVRAIAEGLTNSQIADTMEVSHHTVRNHIHQVLRALHMRRRGEVAAWYWHMILPRELSEPSDAR